MPSDVLITPATSKIDFTDGANSTKKLSISGTAFSFNSNLNVLSSTSLSSAFKAEGVNGTLFEVTDDLSNSLMSVNTIGGLPVFEVFANNSIIGGQYGANDFVISGNKIGLGYANPVNKLSVSGSVSIGSSYNVAAPSNGLIVQGNVGIATNNPGYTLEVNGTQRVVGNFYLFNTVVDPASNFANQKGVGFEASTGKLEIAASASTALALGRFGSTGQILAFRYASVQIGGFSLDTNDLTLATARHLILNPTGNVGIGISIPTAPLEVQCNTGATGIILRGRADNSTALRFYANNGTTQQLYIGTDDSNIDFVSVSTRPIRFFVNALLQHQISQLGVFSWKDGAGGDRMTLNSTGLRINNVGDNRLIVYETGTAPYTATLELSSQVYGTYGGTIQYNASPETLTIENYGRTATNSVQGSILFKTKINNTTATNVMLINGFTGNVGIGATDPLAKLHVRGDQVYLYNDLNTNNTYFYARNSGAGNAGIKMKNSDGEWTIIANDRLRFIDDDAGVERLSILNNGNVGIGTVTPAYKLDVNGTTRFGGIVYNEAVQTDDFNYFNLQPYIESETLSTILSVSGTAPTFTTLTNTAAPFSKVLSVSAYGQATMSDFIPVQAGETIYGEIWAYRATGAAGTAGALYCGVQRYDKDKNMIDGNAGLNTSPNGYFIAYDQTIPSNSTWTKYSGTLVLPISHTVHNNSDGGPVRYIRPYIIYNYTGGTILTYITGWKIRKVELTRDSGIVSINGSVGVGTISPNQKLSVYPGITGGIALQAGDGTTRSYYFIDNTNPTYSTGIRTNNYYLDFDSSGASQNAIRFYTGTSTIGTGTERMRITSNGNIGMGVVTSPNHLLHLSTVSNDVSIGLYTTNANTNARNWLISANEIAYGDFNIKQSNAIGGNPRSAGTSRFYIQNDGNVGIGITSPNAKFVVNNNGGTGNAFYVDVGNRNDVTTLFEHTGANTPVPFRLKKSGYSGTGATYGILNLQMNDGTVGNGSNLYFTANDSAGNEHEYGGLGAHIITNTNGAESGDLVFYTSDAGTIRSEKVRIKFNGNVGIGTTVPTAKLDVLGVRLGRDFSIANRATVRLDSNGTTYPSDVLFGHTAAANQDGWTSVYWSLSSRADASSNRFYFYRGGGNPAPNNSEAVIMSFDPNLNVGVGFEAPTNRLSIGGSVSIGSNYNTAATTNGLIVEGSVGIGITNPADKLHVIGNIRINGGDILNWSGQAFIQTIGANDMFFRPNSTLQMILTAGGNLGVGNGFINPLAKLHLNSTTSGATLLRADGTNGTLFSVVDDLSDSLMSVNNSAGLPVLEVFADDRVVAGQYGANDFVLINNKLGLGTNSPAYKLDVRGSTVNARVGLMEFGTWPLDTTYIYLQNNTLSLIGGNYGFLQGPAGETFVNAASGQTLHFRIGNSEKWAITSAGILQSDGLQTIRTSTGTLTLATNGTNGHIILSPHGTGNVGIGTATPGSKLEVGSTNDGILTLNKSSGTGWGYINFSQAGTRRFYFGLNASFEPELGVDNGTVFRVVGGMTVAGNTVLNAGNYGGYSTFTGAGTFIGNIAIITDASTGDYSLIAHKYAGVTKAFSGYNGGLAIYGGETGIPTRIQANGQYVLTALTNGNIGIGTVTPAAKLDVVGSTRLSSNLLSHKVASYTTSYPGISSFGADTTDSAITYYDTGKLVANTEFRGVVWTGKHYIFTSLTSNLAYFYDNNFNLITNSYGLNSVSLPLPSGYSYPHGAAWDGRYLWAICYVSGETTASKIVGYDLDSPSGNAAIIAESAPLTNITGAYDIEYVDGHFYIVRSGSVYIYRWNGSTIDLINTIVGEAGSITAQAITYDGSYLWVTQNGQPVYKLGLDGYQEAVITSGFPPNTCGWAWNGSNIVAFNYAARNIYIINTARLRIDTQKLALMGGNVGIGTASPIAALDVRGRARVQNNTAATAFYVQQDDGSSDVVEFYRTSTSNFILKNNGNVGIGKTAPNAKLNVLSTSSLSSVFKTEGVNGTLFEVTDDLSNSLMSVNTIGGLPVLEVFANNSIIAGQYGQNDFVISGNKVGIGTASPSYKLHVNGTGYFSGTLIVNGITINQERATNARMYGAGVGEFGLLGLDSAGTFRWQIYGGGGSYGFLESTWGNWDIRKAVNGELDIRVSGALVRVLNAGTTSAPNLSIGGTAATATARNINGTSFDHSANITTATWGTARTLTIGSTGKSVDGSAAVAWTLAEIGAVPVAGGTMSGVLTTTTPGVQTSVTGLSAFNAGVNVGERNVGSVPGFVPGYGQTTLYTSGYRSHMILGSYRTASSWGGGPFIAWGGNDSNATEYWLFNQGGAITHSGGKTMAYADGTNAGGSWPISITGSSATAGSATTAAGLSATLAVASGGTGGNTQALGRTGLGATTLGANLFTLPNTSTSKKYIEINADNTVTLLEAAAFRNAIGAGTGGGSGTVTGVTASAPLASSEGTAPNISLSGAVALANGGSGQTSAQAAMNAFAGAVTNTQYLRGNGTNVVMSAIQVIDVPILNQNTTGSSASCSGTAATANALNTANNYTVAQMTVSTSATPSSYVIHTGTSPSAIRLLAYTDSTYIQSGTSTSSSSADLVFSSMQAGAEWMRIKGATGRLGIGTSTPAYLLDVNGTIHYTTLTASSDGRFKKNVQPIPNALDRLSYIRGVKFEWNEFINDRRNGYELNKPTFGVIAQELEEVFPELITLWKLSDDCADARSVNYEKIIPILIEAVKELNNKNKLLESRLLILENK